MKKNEVATVSVIIPTYNEEDTIGEIIKKIISIDQNWEIIVVDDGSSDKSFDIASSMEAKVLRNPYNIGLGGCLKRGAREAKGDILIFIDGDGQHPPEEIHKLLEEIEDYNMIVGSRDFSQQTYQRGLGNWLLRRVAEIITRRKIPDLTIGFRSVWKNNFMEFIHLLPNGYSSATTLTIAMFEAGLFIKFVPISDVKFRISGKSKVKFLRDGLFFLKTIIRIIMMFSPLKVFFPVSIVIGITGCGMSAYDIITGYNLQESSVLMVILSAITFSFGVMADYLSQLRRDINVRTNKGKDHK